MHADEIDKLLNEYGRYMRAWDASENTISVRQRVMRARLREWDLAGFTEDNLREWLARDGLSRWSRSTYYAHANDFCSWLVATGRLAENPVTQIRQPSRPKSRPRPLTEVEVGLVLNAAKGKVRDQILLALYAGLRAHEVAKIKGEDVTPEGIWVIGKGGVHASIPTHPELWRVAQRYPRRGHWFPGRRQAHIATETVTNQVSALLAIYDIDGSIHRFRHVYGTRLLRAGVNIRTVQQLMRHSSLETTAAYTAVSEDELRAGIERLS